MTWMIRHKDPDYVVPTSTAGLRMDLDEIISMAFEINNSRVRAKETMRWFYSGKRNWRHPKDTLDNWESM